MALWQSHVNVIILDNNGKIILEWLKMEKYQYIEKIGSGSYGEVSLIKDKKDQKKYVVKKVSLLGSYRYV